MGIKGQLLQWIKEFLTNRQQQVRIGKHLSPKEWVRSGVPQGSVLGPLLFLIMMADIDEDIKNSQLSSYADDTRVWRIVCNEAERMMLQGDLYTLYEWAERNNAKFNGEKFEGMSFPEGPESNRTYLTPDNLVIKNKKIIKDLGVYFSNNCQFSEHIKIYVKETQKIAAWNLRTFLSRELRVLKVLLQSLIVPKIRISNMVSLR